MINKKVILSVFLVIILSLDIFAVEEIGVDQGNPPFMYEENNEAKGLYPEIIMEVFNRIGVPVEIKPLPWKRAVLNADNGKAGIGGIYKNEERLKKYDYSEELFQEKILIYVMREKNFVYRDISDLYGRNIGILSGWSYGKEFDNARKNNRIKIQEVESDEQNFKKLLYGRVDCILAIKETGDVLMSKNMEFRLNIVQIDTPFLINSTYLIFPKSLKKKDLIKKFNEKLLELKKNGEYDIIVKKAILDR